MANILRLSKVRGIDVEAALGISAKTCFEFSHLRTRHKALQDYKAFIVSRVRDAPTFRIDSHGADLQTGVTRWCN